MRKKAVYVALGMSLTGEREVLGLWFQQTEGAKFWLSVLTDLKTRGPTRRSRSHSIPMEYLRLPP